MQYMSYNLMTDNIVIKYLKLKSTQMLFTLSAGNYIFAPPRICSLLGRASVVWLTSIKKSIFKYYHGFLFLYKLRRTVGCKINSEASGRLTV